MSVSLWGILNRQRDDGGDIELGNLESGIGTGNRSHHPSTNIYPFIPREGEASSAQFQFETPAPHPPINAPSVPFRFQTTGSNAALPCPTENKRSRKIHNINDNNPEKVRIVEATPELGSQVWSYIFFKIGIHFHD